MRINNAFSQIIIELELVVSLKKQDMSVFCDFTVLSSENKKLPDLVKSQEL